MSKISNPLQILLLIIVSAVMVGCVVAINPEEWDGHHADSDNSWEERERANSLAIDRLAVGRSMDSVLTSMGQPDVKEAFVRHGVTYDVYFYRTHREHSDGRTTKDECVPLVFIQGELVGWGESAIQYAVLETRN